MDEVDARFGASERSVVIRSSRHPVCLAWFGRLFKCRLEGHCGGAQFLRGTFGCWIAGPSEYVVFDFSTATWFRCPRGPPITPRQGSRIRRKADSVASMTKLPGVPLLGVALLAVLTTVAIGCGSSDQPAYCSNVSSLESSVGDLKDLQLESGVLSTLQADLAAVKGNADAVVSSAKADFPDETGALADSVQSLSSSVEALPASPTAKQLAPIALEVSSTVNAAQALSDATSSACD